VPRSAVAVSLPGSEFRAVRKRLTEAGFEAIAVKSPADVEKLLTRRPDVGFAILDTESDFDGSIAMYGVLRRGDRDVNILMLVPPQSLGRIGLNRGVDPRDEYFTRPYSAESLRWRIEAMLLRAELPQQANSTEPLIAGEAPKTEAGATAVAPGASKPKRRRRAAAAVAGEPVAAATAAEPAQPAGGAVISAARRGPGHERGKIAIVFNPKGGVGKTTISINLGAALQIRRGKRVLLVDCDTITGHVASSLGLERPRTLAGAWRENAAAADGAYETIEQIATLHSSGLSVLVMSESPLHTEILEPRHVADAIAASRDCYDWIILDMHPDYGPLNQALFAQADKIIVPITPDIPCIRAAIQFRDVAAQLDMRDRMSIVVNRANSGVATADLERVVDLPSLARVRSAGLLFVRAADEGRSAVERFPTSKVVADLDAMAGRLLEGTTATDGWSRFASGRRIAGSVKEFLDHFATRSHDEAPKSGPG
jgi:MinD-like ATPase involved in chromosome partitioning or flagellar assembly